MGRLTLSIGLTSVDTADAEQPGNLVGHSDNALYQAKREGRNRTCSWQPDATPAG